MEKREQEWDALMKGGKTTVNKSKAKGKSLIVEKDAS